MYNNVDLYKQRSEALRDLNPGSPKFNTLKMGNKKGKNVSINSTNQHCDTQIKAWTNEDPMIYGI